MILLLEDNMIIRLVHFTWNDVNDRFEVDDIYVFEEKFLADGKTWPAEHRNRLAGMIAERSSTNSKIEIHRCFGTLD